MDRGYNPTLAISLFESADITTQIINGQLASEQSQTRAKTRMGYMGHLTLIAEEVVKFTERHPPELLSENVLDKVMSRDWINYVEGALAETRERDNAILGGVRPEVATNNRGAGSGLAGVGLSGLGSALGLGSSQGQSSALAEAGLNGAMDMHGNSDSQHPGPFSISAGISSGFHSSSDEDDDDPDENDEDVNQEVSISSSRAPRTFSTDVLEAVCGIGTSIFPDGEFGQVETVKSKAPRPPPGLDFCDTPTWLRPAEDSSQEQDDDVHMDIDEDDHEYNMLVSHRMDLDDETGDVLLGSEDLPPRHMLARYRQA